MFANFSISPQGDPIQLIDFQAEYKKIEQNTKWQNPFTCIIRYIKYKLLSQSARSEIETKANECASKILLVDAYVNPSDHINKHKNRRIFSKIRSDLINKAFAGKKDPSLNNQLSPIQKLDSMAELILKGQFYVELSDSKQIVSEKLKVLESLCTGQFPEDDKTMSLIKDAYLKDPTFKQEVDRLSDLIKERTSISQLISTVNEFWNLIEIEIKKEREDFPADMLFPAVIAGILLLNNAKFQNALQKIYDYNEKFNDVILKSNETFDYMVSTLQAGCEYISGLP